MSDMEKIVAYKDEMLLLRWGDNSRDGMVVTFQLPGEFTEHPFKAAASGKKTGQRYAAVLVEIGDDEKPIEQTPKGGPISRNAGQLCRQISFLKYVQTFKNYEVRNAEDLAVWLRATCGIESRAELDHSTTAAAKFESIKTEYLAYDGDFT